MADLVTQEYLASCLADSGLTSGQQALLPRLATAASRLIRKWCNRYFERRSSIDELYTLRPHSALLLREFPVNSVERLATNPTTVLTVVNGSSAVQRATAQLLTTGDADAGQVVTAVRLTRWNSGAKTVSDVAINAGATVATVAAAITAAGNGWSGTADGTYALWPAADLRQVQGALPALGTGAELKIHVDDLPFTLDEETGTVTIDSGSTDPFSSIRFGPYLMTDFGDLAVYGGPLGVRCVYDAGFDTVPEDVQQACVEAVQAMLARLQTDPALSSERAGAYEWTAREVIMALPDPVRQGLALYRNNRA